MDKNLKIKKQLASDLVFEKMKDYIANGTWQIYQKIPTETELAETFGVNRLTVRIALQKLNMIGVLDTRMGDGTYVSSFSFDDHMRDIAEFYMTPKLLEDVGEFRLMLEVECARLAMQRALPEEIDELKACCEAIDRQILMDDKVIATHHFTDEAFMESVAYDLAFHAKICQMSHNNLLMYSFSVARESIRQFLFIVAKNRVVGKAKKNDPRSRMHWALYEAIVNKDLDAYTQHFKAMLDRNSNVV